MKVITIEHITPLPRYDGKRWATVRIQEAPTQSGAWVTLETQTLSPSDPDPREPLTRSITTELAELDAGWYRVVFIDETGDEELPTEPVQNIAPTLEAYMPTVADVGALERSRTVDGSGEELGTFTYTTRPTDLAVVNIIQQASRDVAARVGPLADLSPDRYADAKQLIAIRTAMLIELSYFPEQIPTQESPYNQWKALYDDGITSLYAILHPGSTEGGGGVVDPGDSYWSFPTSDDVHPMVGWDTVW